MRVHPGLVKPTCRFRGQSLSVGVGLRRRLGAHSPATALGQRPLLKPWRRARFARDQNRSTAWPSPTTRLLRQEFAPAERLGSRTRLAGNRRADPGHLDRIRAPPRRLCRPVLSLPPGPRFWFRAPRQVADARTSVEWITAMYHAARTQEPVRLPIDIHSTGAGRFQGHPDGRPDWPHGASAFRSGVRPNRRRRCNSGWYRRRCRRRRRTGRRARRPPARACA